MPEGRCKTCNTERNGRADKPFKEIAESKSEN